MCHLACRRQHCGYLLSLMTASRHMFAMLHCAASPCHEAVGPGQGRRGHDAPVSNAKAHDVHMPSSSLEACALLTVITCRFCAIPTKGRGAHATISSACCAAPRRLDCYIALDHSRTVAVSRHFCWPALGGCQRTSPSPSSGLVSHPCCLEQLVPWPLSLQREE